MLLSVCMTSVLFLVWFNNFALTMSFVMLTVCKIVRGGGRFFYHMNDINVYLVRQEVFEIFPIVFIQAQNSCLFRMKKACMK